MVKFQWDIFRFFQIETNLDTSSFEGHIFETSEYLSVVNRDHFEEETSIFIPEEKAPSAIVGVIQENAFGTLHLRPCF